MAVSYQTVAVTKALLPEIGPHILGVELKIHLLALKEPCREEIASLSKRTQNSS